MGFMYKTTRLFRFGVLALEVAAIGIALYETVKQSQEKRSKVKKPDSKQKFEKNKDLVDETSWESFPASDAPSSARFT